MRRGDLILVTVVLPDAYGRPRPGLVIQSDLFTAHHSVALLPVTSHPCDTPLFRIRIEPDETTGLSRPSQVMVDKAVTMPRGRLGDPLGRIDADAQSEVKRSLELFLGLARQLL